ncbi:MAG: diaminopimelate decarboxylase [Streptosporangiales bacterium]|nr:diaminopimelate decarboxylase [Streptosporangiales bacterium]
MTAQLSARPVSTVPPDDAVWPLTSQTTEDGDLTVGGVRLTDVVTRYGTPAYVIDEYDVRTRCRRFRRAFPDAEIAYAGKAFLCRAMARWVADEGLSLDVVSAGELAIARSVGFPAERILLHGNAKSPQDLRAALDYGVGRIVVDSATEVARLAAATGGRHRQPVLLRVIPGVDAGTHQALTTGVEEQKFGLSLDSGAAEDVVRRILGQPDLELVGLHCHVGSQVTRPDAHATAARRLVTGLARIRTEHDITLRQLDLGGGFPVPYTSAEPSFDLPGHARELRAAVARTCALHRYPTPKLTIEPGRGIAATAGITAYHVLAVKHTSAGNTYVAVDGGMGDNPRCSLYGARYTVRLVGRRAKTRETRPTTVVGRFCETGDIIAVDAPLPADLHPGDVLVVAVTGAYHHSMASNYNAIARPPVIAVRDGRARLLIRREADADINTRDVGL